MPFTGSRPTENDEDWYDEDVAYDAALKAFLLTLENDIDAVAEIAASSSGQPGPAGQSAYEIAVDNGFVGTEAQWLESLESQGAPGASAYQIAVAEGFVGTEAQWLTSLKGDAGSSSTIKDTVASSANLPAASANTGFGYVAADTGHLWVSDGSIWKDIGQYLGPAGEDGASGTLYILGEGPLPDPIPSGHPLYNAPVGSIYEDILTGQKYVLKASDPASLDYITSIPSDSNASVYTFSSVPLGSPEPERQVIINVCSRALTDPVISGVTVGGVAATQLRTPSTTGATNSWASNSWWIVNVPAGDVGTVVATFTAGQVRANINVYKGVRLNPVLVDSDVSTVTVSSSAARSVTVDTDPAGFVVSSLAGANNVSVTWVGVTEDFDYTYEASASVASGGHVATTGASLVVSATPSALTATPLLVVLAFAPAP